MPPIAPDALTPQRLVAELDKHIVGQDAAKRAVAVAIRNRWRRRQLADADSRDVYPKNIILIGPTGVGKTEIARRIAGLLHAPFIKVEATKYTEVGYHGRDVESMIRDLLEQAIAMVRREHSQHIAQSAHKAVEDRLLELLVPTHRADAAHAVSDTTLDRVREQLTSGALEDRMVEITQSHRPDAASMFSGMGLEQMDPDMAQMFERLIPEQTRRRRVTIAQARRILSEQETDRLLDREKITAEAITRTEQSGIIFLDEIDKIGSPSGREGGSDKGGGPDVSRHGVQRDLLSIVEGSVVTTRHGSVRTDHILFIAAGAFHVTSVQDLMPELQGRFPIRVELSPLTRDDFVRILTEPDNALPRQQLSLLLVEGLKVDIAPGSIEAMADMAAKANTKLQDIGARRLMTVVERVFEGLNFEATDMVAKGQTAFTITPRYVRDRLDDLLDTHSRNRS